MKRKVDVELQVLYDVQIDGSQQAFVRHYVHCAEDGRLLRTFDSTLSGVNYTPTGIRLSVSRYDVYTGVMCVQDPDFPGVPVRVRQFLSTSGQISYTTLDGFAYDLPDNGATIVECGGES